MYHFNKWLKRFIVSRWFDAGFIVLSDVSRGLSLEIITQFTPVPSAIVSLAQEDTPSDYPLIDTGFAVTIGSLMASNLHVCFLSSIVVIKNIPFTYI